MRTEGGSIVRIYGLLGHPLGHSFSAAYFMEKFQKEHRSGLVYMNFDFEDLGSGIARLKGEPRLGGFNVTIPYKQAVLPYLDGLSAEAEAIGAVNAVMVEADSGHWIGHNTDTLGFWDSLEDFMDGTGHHPGRKALVLGNGGASQAVQYALNRHGIRYDLVCRPGHGPRAGAGSSAPFGPERVWSYGDLPLPVVREEAFLIVNATSLGMFPDTSLAPSIPYEALGRGHLAFDLVYNPEETLFMRLCRERGARARNGLDMLHRQAEAAWRIWTGKR